MSAIVELPELSFTGGQDVRICVRLHRAQLADLDAWIAAQPNPMTRPEALRTLVGRRLLATESAPVPTPSMAEIALMPFATVIQSPFRHR